MAKYCPFCVGRIDQGNSCPYCNYMYSYKPKPHHLLPGTILKNKYLVGKVLGEGGFGITYVGRDLTLDMKVAIKEYYPSGMATRNTSQGSQMSLVDWSFSPQFKFGKEQFIYEAQTIAKMDKESAVVTVRDFFEENNSAYIVMEYIEGRDLRYFMQKLSKPLSPDDLLPLLEPVFGALGELHNIGLIHRDISPDNIMVENGRARLIDFGCARDTLKGGSEIMLKHSFSPAEQYKNSGMGPWTDVYAMAATIYYCLTGKLPPVATDRLIKDELQPPSALGVKLRPRQERALMKALAMDPKARFQSMEDFGKELFIHKNKYKLVAVAACAVAVLSLAALLVFKPGTRVETISTNKSAIVYQQAGDDISEDENKMLRQVSDIIANSVINSDKDGYYVLNLKNSSDYDISVSFSMHAYNDEGAVVSSSSSSGGEWKKGMKLMPRFYVNNYGLSKITVRANISYNDEHFRTEFIPVTISDENRGLKIELVNELPSTFSYEDYMRTNVYTITGYEFDYTQYSERCSATLSFAGSFDSGKDESYGSVEYRITNMDGAVVDSGSLSFGSLRVGDRFANCNINLFDIPSGEYRIELFESSQ